MKNKRDNKTFLTAIPWMVLLFGSAILGLVYFKACDNVDIIGCADDDTQMTTTSLYATTTTTSSTLTTTVPTTTSTTTTTTTSTTTSTAITTTETTTTTMTATEAPKYLNYIGDFRGTYYHGSTNPCPGGSGRMLEDCTPKWGEMKGSVACRYIQENFGYDINGRTRVYLELPEYPEMNGFYWVDDACASFNVVDFYFIDYATCPWQDDGVTDINLWIEPS